MDSKKVLAAGRGAVGVALFGNLASNQDISDFAYLADEKRLERYRKEPLEINGTPSWFHYVSSAEQFGKADVILIACKFTQFEEVMDEIEPFVKEGTIIISCLNGICTEDMLRERFEQARVFRAIAQNMDSTYLDGKVNYKSRGELVLGMDEPDTEAEFNELVELLKKGDVPVTLSDSIVRDQWKKLMANCGVNQICAAYDLTYGQMLFQPEYRQMFVDVMKEVMAVANARGIDLNRSDIAYWIESALKWNPDSMPSMQQDMKARRQSELALFSGTVVPMAHEMNIPVPLLEDLYQKVAERQAAFESAGK